MSKVFELEKGRRILTREDNLHPLGAKRELSVDFDVGLETALVFFNQIDCLLTSGKGLEPFFCLVRLMVQAECLLALEACGESETKVLFAHPEISGSLRRDLCHPEKFCARLARIRYTHFFDRGSPEFVRNGCILKNILAVPVFERGVSCGCLAAFNSISRDRFATRDALLLAVAAAALTRCRH